MVLYIVVRKGSQFEGTTWYPTKDANGLCSLKGQIGPTGTVTFREEKALFGEATESNKNGVLAGTKYVAALRGTRLRGTWLLLNPVTKKMERSHFTLKLAE